MGVTIGPDGIATVTVNSNSTSTNTSTSSSVPGGSLPLIATIQQAANSGSSGVPGGNLPLAAQQAVTSFTQPASPAASQDMRVRLSPLNIADVIPGGGLLQPLLATGGMMFPYTPTINFTQAVNYMDLQLVHSNTDYGAYTRTPSVTISITGKFTVQNQAEGVYALACLHFLRAVSKMHFGVKDTTAAGLPPPVLVFSGYGNYMFGSSASGLRVVLKNHNWSFDDSVDSIIISVPSSPPPTTQIASLNSIPSLPNGGAGNARLPSMFTVSCELMVVQTPQRMRNVFNFKDFASGALMQGSNTGWI